MINFQERIKKIRSAVDLSLQLGKVEFKLRNEGSYLGIFWYLLNPLLTFGLLFLVFSDRLGSDIPRYALYLLLGVIMFNFFQSSTIESATSILKDYRWVIKSINFSREALVASIVLKNLFSHSFELLFFILVLLFFKISLVGILFYLVILFLLCLFTFGISLILSSLTVYFVDMESIWSFAVRLLWLGTPIFYTIAGQKRLYSINLLNPMYYFITVARDVVVYTRMPSFSMVLVMIFFSLISLFVGLFVFNILRNKFAEKI